MSRVRQASANRVRIVLGNSSLARYPEGGGHWTVFLQYLLGLVDLGHDAFLLETLRSTGDVARDERRISGFFERLKLYGLGDRCALLLFELNAASSALQDARAYGRNHQEITAFAESADLLWNMCGSLKPPLLSLFKRRVFVDLDPGHLQVSALSYDIGLSDHNAFLSVGGKLNDEDCEVPTLGFKWHPFTPFVFLGMWDAANDSDPHAPFSSVTQWNWGPELGLGNRVLSCSKRAAYLRYLALPSRTGRPFELAANIHPQDTTGDRELLRNNGWSIVDPNVVTRSPAGYQTYIRRSRAEISCPKPIFRELKTGWFSDRSACYLATGRPVLAEDTGFSETLPTGNGLVVFRDMEEAAAGVAEIDANYARHSRAARQVAEEHLNSRDSLTAMLDASDCLPIATGT